MLSWGQGGGGLTPQWGGCGPAGDSRQPWAPSSGWPCLLPCLSLSSEEMEDLSCCPVLCRLTPLLLLIQLLTGGSLGEWSPSLLLCPLGWVAPWGLEPGWFSPSPGGDHFSLEK